VAAGFALLLTRPRLWLLAALPALLTSLLALVGGIAGVFVAPRLDELLDPERAARGPLGLVFATSLWAATPLAAALAGFALGLLLTAPLLERLSSAVESLDDGTARSSRRGRLQDTLQWLKAAAHFLVRTPLFLLAALLPFAGPPLAVLWAAHALGFGLSDAPLARHGLDALDRRLWHRRFRAENLGFGLLGLAALLVPPATLVAAPALTVGATLLSRELLEYEREAGLPPPPAGN